MAEDRMLSDEVLLALIKKNSGGGGGGTDDYNDLKNQPKINNNTLVGNKTASDLGLADNTTVQGILDGQEIDSFGDVETALAGKQDATDNNLDTDAKTIVGAINEHEGDISSLKSGFTNLDNEVNGDATTYDFADVITIEDAVPSNLADCSVKIEPVQDLHGYDKPWVGGAGKNKLPLVLADIKAANTDGSWNDNVYTINNGTITVNTDDGGNVTSIKANGTFTSLTIFNLQSVDKVAFDGRILNGCPNNGNFNSYLLAAMDGTSTEQSDSGSGVVLDQNKFASSYINISIRINTNYTANNLMFQPMIRLATETDATFAPYTNVCPISGHTEVGVQRDGKNLFDKDNASEVMNANLYSQQMVIRSSDSAKTCVIPCEPDTTYTVSKKAGQRFAVAYTKEIPDNDVSIYGFVNDNTGTSLTITTGSDAKYIVAYVYSSSADTETASDILNSVQIEKGSTATPHAPYSGKTYTIALGDTIYGGTVDFDSGVMTVDRAIVDLGTLTYAYVDNWHDVNLFYASVPADMKTTGRNALCSNYEIVAVSDFGDKRMYINNPYISQNGNIGVSDTSYNDATTFKTAMDGVQIVYELATPTTIQLTPQQIQLLKGTNTLTASTGQISVTANGVSGSIGAVQEQVNELAGDVAEIKPVDYSTTEQATGRKWLNDPTYIVVIDIGEEKTVTSNTWYTVGNHLGTDTIINGMGITGSGGTVPLQIVEDTTDGIKILQTRNAQVGVRYVWLEYTKTT